MFDDTTPESLIYVIDTAALECIKAVISNKPNLRNLSLVLVHEVMYLRYILSDPESVEDLDSDLEIARLETELVFLQGLWQILLEDDPGLNRVFTSWKLFEVDFISSWLSEEESFSVESLILANGVLEAVRDAIKGKK